ncbi:MAG: glycosyltransferase, partial [Flavobacteriales bacterium]|nr:glycosyltransferase [Flavobacteriales bacterium]
IKSVLNIINALSDKFDFTVVSSNKDADGTRLDVELNCEVVRNNYSVYYLDENVNRVKFYEELVERKKPQVVYYNSMFSYAYTIKPLLYFQSNTTVKNIIAPRGMLGEGALSIKPFKKKVFLLLARFFLVKKVIWYTSTEEETAEVKAVFGERANTFVAQNISSAIKKREVKENFKNIDELKLVFISRVSEKKNLIYLLQLIDSLKELENLSLDIFGPIEDKGYWKKCLEYINLDDRISYKRVLSPNEINSTLVKYHFYVLPSFNENYGHSIVEAINIGVPVIISDETPWKNLEKEEVGFSLELGQDELWKDKIRAAYFMSHGTYKEWSMSCYTFADKTFVNKSIINKNIDLFLSK